MTTEESAGQPNIESKLVRDPNERHATREFVPDGLNDKANVEDGDGGEGDWPGTELTESALSNEADVEDDVLPDDVVRDIANAGTIASPRDLPDPAP